MEIKARVVKMARAARDVSKKLVHLSTRVKNDALLHMADSLERKSEEILKANQKDLASARAKDAPPSFIERLMLSPERVKDMADNLRKVAGIEDPTGEIVGGWRRPNGLDIRKVRVPLGVVGIIYESRPNVTSDVIGLCLKSGNSALLRGGSESIRSNIAIARILAKAAEERGVPRRAIQLIESISRDAVGIMLLAREYIDVIIPRGGAELINRVKEESVIPVIETGVGNCHLYVDKEADLDMALKIAVNAKTQRPSVCNAIETLLVHEGIAGKFLSKLHQKFRVHKVELRGCVDTRRILRGVKRATEEDWHTEYLGLTLAVKVVDSLEEAIDHVNKYGSRHSESVVTNNYESARKFLSAVDAACVYLNASTRFTDGEEFGFGAEMGISTQKLHARGPMGLRELTTTKYLIFGDGQIRE